ncbi:MAG: EAL domain-containing protein [Mycobacteriales bacterium]
MPRSRGNHPSYSAVCGTLLAGLAAWLLLPDRGDTARHVVSDAGFVLAPAWAAWCCWRAGGRAFRLLAAGAAAWSAGSVVWGVQELVLGQPSPYPSWADVGYLAFPLLTVAGLLSLPALARQGSGRLRLAVDGVAVAASLLLITWLGVLAGLARGHDALGAFLALAFPACDLLLASVVILVLDRLPLRSPGALAALGIAGVATTDAVYSALASQGTYRTGGLIDLAWPAAFLVLASAPRRPSAAPTQGRPDGSRLLPSLPAAVAFATLVVSGRLTQGLDPVLTVDLVVLVAALATRQNLLATENASLRRSLEARLGFFTERSEQLATTDPLTGLLNRDAFTGALAGLVRGLDQDGERLGLVLVDLDGFQQVNDAFGHVTGDALLSAVAERLRGALRGDELLARLAGDEFAVAVPGLHGDDDALAVAGRLTGCLTHPVTVGSLEVVLAASAGVATTSSAKITASELLRDADTAMYAAKEAGGGQCRAFAPVMHTAVRDRLQLESDLRAALLDQQLFLHYQPVVDLVADRVAGFEALARWTHPARGPVSPVEFVPAAERTGLVVALERRVLDLALAQLAAWRREHHSLTVAVNVSARHLHEPDFLDVVLGALSRHALPPAALVLEVTESLLFQDDDHVLGVLNRLRTAGVGLALDDFGTGYSSLSRLARYPFDTLKIDQAFVRDLEATESASPVLTATLAMARALGMSVVAEGVETDAQLAFLLRHGCDLAQGYLLSRPGLPEDVHSTLGRRLLPRPRGDLLHLD